MKIAGHRFLLVEDEPIIGFALEDMITQEGALTAFAATEETATRLLNEEEFDGAVLDVNLHGRQSYDLARAILERGIRLVFATGYGDKAHPDDLAEVPTIPKPYTMEAIANAFGSEN